MNRSNVKVLIVVGVLIAAIVAASVLSNITSRIPENDPATVGNTGGNLNNGGYFCEDPENGRVFFANHYDSGYLYSMNPDQTDLKRLYNSDCSNICVGGDHLYFCMETPEGGSGLGFVIKTSGIYRSSKKGSKVECLTSDDALIMNLVGSTLYYQANTGTGVGLKKVHITGKDDPVVIQDSFVINPATAMNGNIYFNGTTNDHYLYAFNTVSETVQALWDGNIWNPVWYDGYFYYMDISDNYKICRYSPASQSVDILTHDRADTFNVGYGYVFYSVSTGDAPGLYRMRLDGSDRTMLDMGYTCDINITESYTYFRHFGQSTPIYYVSTQGGGYPQEFTAAETAAAKNKK